MGTIRNGARSFLNLASKLCKLSHLPNFRNGLASILGPEEANALFAVWTPFCEAIDLLVATDNFFNQFDTDNDDGDGEDSSGT